MQRVASNSALTRQLEETEQTTITIVQTPPPTASQPPVSAGKMPTWTPETTPSTSLEQPTRTDYAEKIPINAANAAKEMLARSSTHGSLMQSNSLLSVNSFDERVAEFDFAQFEMFDQLDADLDKQMTEKGKRIVKILEDGSCMFRAVAEALWNDQERHMQVRTACMDYMEQHRDEFELFCTENWERYVARKRRDREFGNELELMAIACQLKRPIHVYRYSETPTTVYEPTEQHVDSTPIALTYHRNIHYNLLQDVKAKPEAEKEDSRPGSDIFEMNE